MKPHNSWTFDSLLWKILIKSLFTTWQYWIYGKVVLCENLSRSCKKKSQEIYHRNKNLIWFRLKVSLVKNSITCFFTFDVFNSFYKINFQERLPSNIFAGILCQAVNNNNNNIRIFNNCEKNVQEKNYVWVLTHKTQLSHSNNSTRFSTFKSSIFPDTLYNIWTLC